MRVSDVVRFKSIKHLRRRRRRKNRIRYRRRQHGKLFLLRRGKSARRWHRTTGVIDAMTRSDAAPPFRTGARRRGRIFLFSLPSSVSVWKQQRWQKCEKPSLASSVFSFFLRINQVEVQTEDQHWRQDEGDPLHPSSAEALEEWKLLRLPAPLAGDGKIQALNVEGLSRVQPGKSTGTC